MNRLFYFILFYFFLTICSLNEDSKLWKKKNIQKNENTKLILVKEKEFTKEFNSQIKLDLSKIKIKIKNKIFDNQNNFGSLEYSGLLNKAGFYKFSKFKELFSAIDEVPALPGKQ